MTQTVSLGKNNVLLETDVFYTGSENPSDQEKLIRKAIGLPQKKQLIYYPNKNDQASAVNVLRYQILEMYEITERWYTLEIQTEDARIVRIHSSFLADMQKPNFIADMKEQFE